MAKVRIEKTWNTGEVLEQEVEVPEGKDVLDVVRSAAHTGEPKGIWTEPDGRELEDLEDVRTYGRRAQGLIWRDEGTTDSLTITW